MSVSPDKIGQNGETIRPEIQTLFDKIDSLLKDPYYVLMNNKHPEVADGGLSFYFQFEGMLNDAELETMNNGWNDWDVHVAKNDSVNPRDSASRRTWSFKLTKNANP